jgi:hypothetical protein
MFYNLSNHPHINWGNAQLEAARKWGGIEDVPFPKVPAQLDEQDILRLARECVKKVKMSANDAIFVAGEYGIVFPIIDELLNQEKTVLSTVSDGKMTYRTTDNGTSERITHFNFLEFIPYRRFQGPVTPISKKKNIVLNCNGNRPLETWDNYEKETISKLGSVKDFPIEDFSFQGLEKQDKTIEGLLKEIDAMAPKAIILGGIFYPFFIMADALIQKGYDIFIKASDRNVTECLNPDGSSTKISEYSFKKLRKILRFDSLGDNDGK